MADTSWAELIDELRADNRSGATALARRAAAGLPSLADSMPVGPDSLAALRDALRALAGVRPPFAPLVHLASRAASLLTRDRPGEIRSALENARDWLVCRLEREHERIVGNSASALANASARHVLTISSSSAVRDSLLRATCRGATGFRVTCLESRPGREGLALAAELAAGGLDVRVAADAATAALVAEADLVLLGGDTWCADGLIHKLGTLGLAVAARERRIPVWALAGSLKLLPRPVRGWVLDGGPASELVDPAPAGVEVWNRYFDLTPLALLGSIVTEAGPARPSQTLDEHDRPESVHPWLLDLLEA